MMMYALSFYLSFMEKLSEFLWMFRTYLWFIHPINYLKKRKYGLWFISTSVVQLGELKSKPATVKSYVLNT